MGNRWRSGLLLGAVALIVGACGISNPGAFTTTVLTGSSLVLTNASGTPTAQFDVGVAQCSDGRDNDVDSRTDFGSDQQCDSATDANERLDGVQAHVAPTWVMNVDSKGAITADPASIDFQPIEECFSTGLAVWCMGITIIGTGPVLTGTISPADGTLELEFRANVEVDGIVGFPGLSPSCQLGPISGTLRATDYDKTTGAATLTVADMAVPAVSGCGSSGLLNYDSLINSTLSLPGQADVTFVTSTLDGAGTPVG